jgi:hypothetical protein
VLPIAVALFGALPIVGVVLGSRLLMKRKTAKLVGTLLLAGLIAMTIGCGRLPANLASATSPEPSVSVPSPTPSC